DERLVADEEIARSTRSTDAAAIFRVADQFSQVARILHDVAQREAIIVVDLMIESCKAVVVVNRLQNPLQIGERRARALRRLKIAAFGRKTQVALGLIDLRNLRVQIRGVGGRSTAPLRLVVQEDECLVLLDGAAEGTAKLILSQCVR